MSLHESKLDELGLEFDRNWVLATRGDSGWEMITQRTYSTLVLVQPQIECNDEMVLILNAPNMPELRVPLQKSESVPIQVWKSQVMGMSQGPSAREWFSAYLGVDCELFAKDRTTIRALSEKHTPHPSLFSYPTQTAFADGFPLLLLSEESVTEFKSHHPEPDKVRPKTFRANIIIRGCIPYQEESFLKIRIGNVEFVVTARCTRCVMTNNDTETGIPGKDTLKLLMKHRRVDPGAKYEACMGMNMIHTSTGGMIRLGDRIEVQAIAKHDRRGIWKGSKTPVEYLSS
jgi:uncharacterized protein YcbX